MNATAALAPTNVMNNAMSGMRPSARMKILNMKAILAVAAIALFVLLLTRKKAKNVMAMMPISILTPIMPPVNDRFVVSMNVTMFVVLSAIAVRLYDAIFFSPAPHIG